MKALNALRQPRRGMIAGASVLLLFCTLSTSIAAVANDRQLIKIRELWFTEGAKLAPYRDAFRLGLAEIGYVEGRNVTFITRYARADAARIPALLAELIEQKVDILFVAPRAALVFPIPSRKALYRVSRARAATSLARPGCPQNRAGSAWS
jgi:hypothetical protein